MQSIYQIIEAKFKVAFKKLGFLDDCEVLLTEATKDEFGDYQVNGVMKLAKTLKKNPRELATSIINLIDKDHIIAKLEIAGPGFINITLLDSFLAKYVMELNPTNRYGVNFLAYQNQTVVIDYSSPNLAKEMHVGHLRSTVIGDSLNNIFAYLGDKLIRQNHVGDWGTQFGMLIAYMLELKQNGDDVLEYNLGDLEEFYRKAKCMYDENQEFQEQARHYVVVLQNWHHHGDLGKQIYDYWQEFARVSLKHCNELYTRLGVSLNPKDIAPESMYNDKLETIVKALEAKHLITISDGAKCVFFAEGELEGGHSTPFIVQKKDGGFLYSTTDLAAIDYRCNSLHGNRILYVVDSRQSLHFKQLFLIAKKAGFASAGVRLEHIQFGTMMGADGKPFKTRTGGTVKLVDLIDEASRRALAIIDEKAPDLDTPSKVEIANKIAIASIKYADLSKNRTSDYIFDFDKMLSFEGNTAPYLLYAYTRIQSLLKKASSDFGYTASDYQTSKIIIVKDIEHKLCLSLSRFADTLNIVAQECYPHYLCQYLYGLSGVFMQFYETCNILKETDKKLIYSRLLLVSKVSEIIQLAMGLLGIETIEKM